MTCQNIEVLQVGVIGAVIETTIKDDGSVVDLTGNSLLEIFLRKPDKTVVTKVAVLSNSPGTDGKIRYVTISGDIDAAGCWKVQGHVVIPTGDFKSRKDNFEVEDNLA